MFVELDKNGKNRRGEYVNAYEVVRESKDCSPKKETVK